MTPWARSRFEMSASAPIITASSGGKSVELNPAGSGSRLDAIESSVADLDGPALKDRIAGLKSIRDQAQAETQRTAAALESTGQQTITPAMVGSSPRPPVSGFGSPAAATAGTIFRRSPSASRSQTARSESSDRRAIYCTRSRPLRALGRLRLAFAVLFRIGVPKGIRTPVTAVKGRCPRPLDDGDVAAAGHGSRVPRAKLQRPAVYPGRAPWSGVGC